MNADRRLDSPSRFVRAIERWKRGAIALLMVALIVGATGIAVMVLVKVASDAIDIGETWRALAIVLIPAALIPWIAGGRSFLRTIGRLATIADDSPQR